MAVNQDELERDIQSAEREFLVEGLTDDEEDVAGATDEDDVEFDEQLELAGEITLRTGSASSDEVVGFLGQTKKITCFSGIFLLKSMRG